MFERWKWSMNDIYDLYWDEFWDLAEAVKILDQQEAEAIKKARGRR